jgi:hypothetical protein
MAVTSIYDLAIPGAYSAAFVNGERALSVAATINGASGRANYYLSKWFDFQGGAYTLRAVAEDASLWAASVTKDNGRTVYTSAPAQDPTESTIYLPPGRHRLDILLSNITTGASACFVAFSLFQDGKLVYASSGTGWVFDTAPITDSAVPTLSDPRLAYPIFSVQPNWKNGVVERIDYVTEIFGSESDTEQRRSLRLYPRRSFEATFERHTIRRARLENFFMGTGKNECLVPLWHEAYTLTGTLGATLDFPEDTLALREFRAGDLVWVNDNNPSLGEVLTIASIDLGLDRITFAAAPAGTWGKGAKVFPLRVARVLDTPQMSNVTDRVGAVQARFSLKDSEKWPDPSWGFCAPIFRFPINRATPLTLSIERPTANVIDNEFGASEVFDIYGVSRSAVNAGLVIRGRANLMAYRQFIAMARGKAMRFWFPSLTLDAAAVGDFGGPYMDIADVGLAEYLKRQQDTRVMFGVVFKTARPTIYRRIESIVEATSTTERIFFQSDMPAISIKDVERLMFILPARFDQDGFEFHHLVNDCAVVRTSVLVRSSNADGLPDIECFTTSKPYPLEDIHAMDVGFGIDFGRLQLLRYPAEGMDAGFGIDSGSMPVTVVYRTYDFYAPEAMDVGFGIDSGSMPVTTSYGTYDNYAPEAMDVGFGIDFGTLELTLITYPMAPEGMDVGFQIMTGTLL